MLIRLLGTGAAEGIPAMFSDTRVSCIARREGGREVRTRASALIDGCLKVDFGPDSLAQIHRDRLDARDWCGLIFTHSHDDHFSPSEIQYFLHPFSQCEHMPFPILANEAIVRRIRDAYPEWPMELVTTRSFETVHLVDYAITPIRANHLLEEDSHNLIFERAGERILYGTDTGIWGEETWKFLEGAAIDLLVLECTNGRESSDYFGHLGIPQMLDVLDRMRKVGALKPDATVVSTHHSHNGDMTYAELESDLAQHGIVAGYDGLEVWT